MKEQNWGENPVDFIQGLRLSELFYRQVVQPLLQQVFPGLRYTAALVGYGSDVLVFDTPMSRDHMWGPRLVLFLSEEEFQALSSRIDETLRRGLPPVFQGYPTHFSSPDIEGVRRMVAVESGPIDHLVLITTIPEFVRQQLGFDVSREPDIKDWLTFPEQRLLELTAGGVFHDDLGLEDIRRKFEYYPKDVWLYLLACQWTRISQEEAFVGRTGDVGDMLGSQIIAARLASDMMRLAFIMERRYAPYSKWFGSAFGRLAIAGELGPVLESALSARHWKERQERLANAYEIAAEKHNALSITPPLEARTTAYFGRPFRVIFANRFAQAIRDEIQDQAVKSLPLYGSVNQFCNSTDILESPEAFRKLGDLYT